MPLINSTKVLLKRLTSSLRSLGRLPSEIHTRSEQHRIRYPRFHCVSPARTPGRAAPKHARASTARPRDSTGEIETANRFLPIDLLAEQKRKAASRCAAHSWNPPAPDRSLPTPSRLHESQVVADGAREPKLVNGNLTNRPSQCGKTGRACLKAEGTWVTLSSFGRCSR